MSGLVNYELFASRLGSGNCGFTIEGGFYEKFINNTGVSVKGTIVVISKTVSNAVDIAPANSNFAIGVIYENGIQNGLPVKVVVYGKAQVLLKDSESSGNGFLCLVSDVPGRMYTLDTESQEIDFNKRIGHSLEVKFGANNVLSLVQLKF